MRKSLFILFSFLSIARLSYGTNICGIEISEDLLVLTTTKSPLCEYKKSINLQSDGKNIVGILHLPTTPKPASGYPVVILLHGFRGSKHGTYGVYQDISSMLSQQGIASLRFDMAGCKDSEGISSETSINVYLQNAKDIINFAQTLPELDYSRIGLAGFSYGCHVALDLCKRMSPFSFMIKALSIWAPIADGGLMLKEFKDLMNSNSEQLSTAPEELALAFGVKKLPIILPAEDVNIFLSIQDHIVLNSIPYKIPILHAQGEKDKIISMLQRQLYVSSTPKNVTFELFKDSGHDIALSPESKAIKEKIVEYFVSNL